MSDIPIISPARLYAERCPPPAPVEKPEQKKWNWIGAPKVFELELACQQVVDAFDSEEGFLGCFLVGSATERKDWRDVDLRMMFIDETFFKLFPGTEAVLWEHDPRWLLMTASISEWISKRCDLPVDFQFQPMTWANKTFKGKNRYAVGMRITDK